MHLRGTVCTRKGDLKNYKVIYSHKAKLEASLAYKSSSASEYQTPLGMILTDNPYLKPFIVKSQDKLSF